MPFWSDLGVSIKVLRLTDAKIMRDTCENAPYQKGENGVGKGIGEREASYTVGGNADCSSHSGKQI